MNMKNIPSPEKSINLFHCLNELGDHSVVEEIQQYLKSGRITEAKLSSSQWSAVAFVLLTSEKKMDEFHLDKFVKRSKAENVKVLQMLLPVVKESRSVHLKDCGVTDEGCAALASALKSNPSHLRELDLSGNKLESSGVTRLCDLFEDPHCKLEKLELSDCGITDEGCAALASALRSNPEHLRELNLSSNKMVDWKVNLLSDLLKNPHCKLEKLSVLNLNRLELSTSEECVIVLCRLRDCGITYEGCVALTSALRSNPGHLRHLDLSVNELGDSVNLLSSVLEDLRCKLEILWLSDCGITDEGCTALASALRSNPEHLRQLGLSGNNIRGSGVKVLSDLKDDQHYELKVFFYCKYIFI
uniref:NACHT LRR and PYD domain-containing protein n=1 Tax=Cyprinus carpio TaxID=7962 RepID=A0A8C2BFR5_CYPCA